MEFTQGVRDYVSRQGGLVVVNGSIEVLVQRGQGIGLFWTLKLVPKDMTLDHNLKPILVTFNPSYGYIRTQNFASAQRERGAFQCESGGICLGFTDDLHEIVELLGSPRFTVAILRWPDSFDLTSMVDMSGRQAMQQQVEFFSCLERLTGYWENRLPK
jgi:hypothetical protein